LNEDDGRGCALPFECPSVPGPYQVYTPKDVPFQREINEENGKQGMKNQGGVGKERGKKWIFAPI
jgi:hypothetical protein